MNLREIRELVRLQPREPDPVARRLGRCHDVGDLRRVARRLTPRPVFDYVDGGADDEVSMAANVRAFRRWRFLPRALVDVSTPDTTVPLFDRMLPLPLVLCPTGYTRMMHPAGERAVATAAHRRGLPYTLSTMGSTSIDDVAATGHGDLWFQLYILKDRGLTREMVDRAAACGYRALAVAVDTVVAGRRVRDLRNGLTIPPQLTVRTLASIAAHPGYWVRMLASPAITFANFTSLRPGITIEQTADLFSAAITWDDIAELRQRWPGKLLVKGPLGVTDVRRALDVGVDGIWLSNHGGRQLDRTVAPVDLVADVREAVGDGVAVIVDSGIRHGADIAVALALGADAGAIGRVYLYGLMAGGEAGVHRALDLLTIQFTRTLQLLGVTSVAELRKHGRSLLTGS